MTDWITFDVDKEELETNLKFEFSKEYWCCLAICLMEKVEQQKGGRLLIVSALKQALDIVGGVNERQIREGLN